MRGKRRFVPDRGIAALLHPVGGSPAVPAVIKPKQKVATDTASLPKIAADAEASNTGAKYAGLGLAYFSYQQYDKAVAALTNALAKGGLKNEAETRLLLGIAQVHAGKKDDAVKTFELVKGDAKLERLAALWAIRARKA